MVPAPQLGVIAPGQTREYLIRVPVGAPVFGAYEMSGEVRTAGGKAAFVAEAESYPWRWWRSPGCCCCWPCFRVVLRRRPAAAGP